MKNHRQTFEALTQMVAYVDIYLACKLQSQHIEQRMARIVAAAENGVPAIYICGKELVGTDDKVVPFDPKHYQLMYKIGDINRVPTFFFHWPTRGKGYIH